MELLKLSTVYTVVYVEYKGRDCERCKALDVTNMTNSNRQENKAVKRWPDGPVQNQARPGKFRQKNIDGGNMESLNKYFIITNFVDLRK